MTKHEAGRDREPSAREGLGDDQGTRVGSPTPDARRAREVRQTGAGAEAAEGIHSADGDREESDATALEGKETGRGEGKDAERAGSEPMESRKGEHWSRYGGDRGEPKR